MANTSWNQMQFFVSAKPPFIPELFFQVLQTSQARGDLNSHHTPPPTSQQVTQVPRQPHSSPVSTPEWLLLQERLRKRPSAIEGTDQPHDPTKGEGTPRGPAQNPHSVSQTNHLLTFPRGMHRRSGQRITDVRARPILVSLFNLFLPCLLSPYLGSHLFAFCPCLFNCIFQILYKSEQYVFIFARLLSLFINILLFLHRVMYISSSFLLLSIYSPEWMSIQFVYAFMC